MRSSLNFPCQELDLTGSLDEGTRSTGLLIVTGGTEIRSGAHGGLAQLAARLARQGYPVFRFDRRGVGDSAGEDPGFADSGDDLAAARKAFAIAAPAVTRVIALGLCDGATALALHHARLELAGMILVNPWVVEPRVGLPPPAAIKRRYAERLTSLSGWKKVLTGSVDYRKALRGALSLAAPKRTASLAVRVGSAFTPSSPPVELILARHDATALAFLDAWRAPAFAPLRGRASTRIVEVDSRSHSFARRDEPERLAELCRAAITRIESGAVVPPR